MKNLQHATPMVPICGWEEIIVGILIFQQHVHMQKYMYKEKGEGLTALEHGTFYGGNISIKMEAT